MPQISVRDLTCGYDGHVIFTGLTFDTEPGDYVCIVGENGSGKTTLMKTMLGLQKPISGTISFENGLRFGEIGYLPQQNALQKDFPATVWEIVLSGFQGRMGLKPFYGKHEKTTAWENMEAMNITSFARRCYRELSGGQQQRVLLARALCSTQKVLLLDEPVTGLDPKVSLEMYELIKKLNHEKGITILMISHDISSTINYASKILHIGHETFFGTVNEYINSSIGKVFLSQRKEEKA